ncbi:hypothetical protein [Demequina sp.]|uniref:hypothetical protein n=1 Tax=Demequina sp. TaxID=2050685 RepID=UPI0025F57D10|nr:hypothetical protein [Demequina sp.]
MDIAIQIAGIAIIVAAGWAVVTGGYFQRAVDNFSGWYVGDIAPRFALGTAAVVPGQDFRNGFFADRPMVPDALQHPGPGYLTVAEIGSVVEAAPAS